MSSSKFRSVRKVLPSTSPHWVGDGFKVFPVFGNLAFKEELSPLLMFDYAAPKKFPGKDGAPLGVGSHPHRGFET
jgi:redox-sensitive bicupin YhaK (pirin superfamily)